MKRLFNVYVPAAGFVFYFRDELSCKLPLHGLYGFPNWSLEGVPMGQLIAQISSRPYFWEQSNIYGSMMMSKISKAEPNQQKLTALREHLANKPLPVDAVFINNLN